MITTSDYFGDAYEPDSNSYRFFVGDRIPILEMVKYVKKIVDANSKDGLQYHSW